VNAYLKALRLSATCCRRTADALGVAALLLLPAGAARAQEVMREADTQERIEWMERMRAYPGLSYDQNAVSVVRSAEAAGLRRALVAVTPWRSVGPFGFLTSGFYGSSPNADGGRIRTAAIHPVNPQIIYAGAASGGVWKTTNGGASWVALTDQACSVNSGSIAIDPVNPELLYVGTGEPTQSSGFGLLRSFDGGLSWSEINGSGVLAPTTGLLANQAYRLRIDRATAGSTTGTTVLYAASNGLHRSTNSGTSWTTVLGSFVTDVVADPQVSTTWWAARVSAGANSGLYRSTDNGLSWTLVHPFQTTVQRVQLAVTPAAPGKVWMVEVVSSRFAALRVYDDATSTLTTLGGQGVYNSGTRLDFGTQSTYNLVLEVDPANANVLYMAGSRMYRSRDGGNSFSIFAYDLHVDWHVFTFAPSDANVIVAGNDGGVYLSTDRGNSWVSRNTNLATSQFYPGIAVHPTLQDVIAGGLQDNSSLWGFGASFWTMSSPSGDGGWNAWNQQNPTIFWSTSYSAGYVMRHSWSASTGLANAYRGFTLTNERKAFFPPLVIDPTNGSTLYYATYRLWRTTNEGQTWGVISNDLTKGSGVLSSFAVSPADSRVLWSGANDGAVQVSEDGGATFTNVTGTLPNRAVADIIADPTNPRRAMVVFSGRDAGRVYLTSDLGATWTNISTGLPDIPFNAGVFIPGTTRLFAAADVGVYESTDDGASWTLVSQGVPNVRITDLVFQQATGTLYAATYGRGIWATTVLAGPGVLRGDVDRNGTVNAFDAALVQQALTGVRPSVAQPALPNGDANCNGMLDSGDALAILQFSVGGASPGCVGVLR
jgi:photosystem II stability/assembly factor-like uncharacterized protein